MRTARVIRSTRVTRSTRAGLVFPMSRVRNQMKKKSPLKKTRFGWGATAYMTGVLEYLTAELLELSGNSCRDNKRRRIAPRDIMLAVRFDEELHTLLQNVVLPNAGVVPSINGILSSPPASSSAATVGTPKPTRKQSLPKLKKNTAKQQKLTKTKPAKRVSKSKSKATALDDNLGVTLLRERVLRCGVKLTVVSGDIATVETNAVVIPSSSNFSLGGQVASHINRISGGALLNEISAVRNGPIASGGAAFLKCSQMRGCNFEGAVFCNGPSWGDAATAIALLEQTTRNSLLCAQNSGMKSVAFPAIGSGVGNFPKQTAVETILRAISGYLNSEKHDLTDVIFVLHDKESIQVYVTELGRLQE